MEHINLLGSDDVRAAGVRIASAASDMHRAVSYLDDILTRNQRFLDDWLLRLEEVIKKGGNHGS